MILHTHIYEEHDCQTCMQYNPEEELSLKVGLISAGLVLWRRQ